LKYCDELIDYLAPFKDHSQESKFAMIWKYLMLKALNRGFDLYFDTPPTGLPYFLKVMLLMKENNRALLKGGSSHAGD